MIREKYLIGTGAIVVIITIIFLMVEPVIHERHSMVAQIPQLREDLAWMKRHLNELQQLRDAGMPVATEKITNLTPMVVEDALRHVGLLSVVTGLKPGKQHGIEINFEKVEYEALIEFLFDLKEHSNARVSLARIVKMENAPGMVSATISLVSGQY